MRIYGLQLDIRWEDPPANRERVARLLAEKAPEPGSLVVLPEMFSTGFSMRVEGLAEPHPGPTESYLSELAARHQVFLLGGVSLEGTGGRGRNTALAFGPTGQALARYTKMHPFSFAGEHQHFEPGNRILDFPWHRLRVAPYICYDLRFPELFRRAALRRIEVLAVIANWPAARAYHWRTLLLARAIENQAYVIGVNRCGSDPKHPYSGDSMLISPQGEVLCEGGNAEGWVEGVVDSDELYAYRARFPVLSDIREHLLGR